MIVVLFAVLLESSLHLPYLDAQANPAVLGTDRNGDSVRDEIDRYILKTYPNDTQADLRAALLEVACSAQALLRAAKVESPKMSEHVKAYLGARNCIYSLFSEKAVECQ